MTLTGCWPCCIVLDMTNTDRGILSLLMDLHYRHGDIPQPESSLGLRFLVDDLVERGLLIRQMGGLVTTSSAADRLLKAMFDRGAEMVAEFNPCPYDHSHTRDWCGREFCRPGFSG